MNKPRILLGMGFLFVLYTGVARCQGSLDQRLTELSRQISGETLDYQKRTIAVLGFSDLDGNVTGLEWYLAEDIDNTLASSIGT